MSVKKRIDKLMFPVIQRLALACTMVTLAVIGMVSPITLLGIIDRDEQLNPKQKDD